MNQYDVDDVGKNINKEILWFHQPVKLAREDIERKSSRVKVRKTHNRNKGTTKPHAQLFGDDKSSTKPNPS